MIMIRSSGEGPELWKFYAVWNEQKDSGVVIAQRYSERVSRWDDRGDIDMDDPIYIGRIDLTDGGDRPYRSVPLHANPQEYAKEEHALECFRDQFFAFKT